MLQKLVPVVWCQKLACVSVNLVPVFSGTSFLHAIENSSIPSQKLSSTWHEPCDVIGQLFWCKKLCWNCVIFLVQVSGTSFLSVCRWHKFLYTVLFTDQMFTRGVYMHCNCVFVYALFIVFFCTCMEAVVIGCVLSVLNKETTYLLT